MTETSSMTFYSYLANKVQAQDVSGDPVGDFVSDAEADSFFPRQAKADAEGFATVTNYLYYHRHACADAMDAFMDAWSMYYKHVTGRDWIDQGYSSR